MENKDVRDELEKLWLKYREEYDHSDIEKRLNVVAYTQIESGYLYAAIRHFKPKNILEISPGYGGTTLTMLSAIEKNDEKCKILSYDVLEHSKKFDRNDRKVERKLIVGDVKNLLQREDIENCDFLFIDSDHGYPFGEWYSKNIIPFIKENTFVFIHDWPGYEQDGSHRNIPSGYSNPSLHQEPKAVKEHCVQTGLLEPIVNLYDHYPFTGDHSNYALTQIMRKTSLHK